MGLFGWKERLRDVPEVQPLLQKSRRVVFFAPHTSEHPAVLPLVSKLSAGLRESGRECETHSIEDMRAAVASISARLSKLRLGKEELDRMERILRMKDAIVRLGIAVGILDADERAMLMEMHALPGDFALGDRFGMGGRFYRIPGTRILYARDYVAEYAGPLALGSEALSHGGSAEFRKAIEIAGADPAETEKARAMVSGLQARAPRAMLVEVPAPLHYSEDRVETKTAFGRNYGAGLSGPHSLTHWEMDRILGLLS